MDPEGLKNKFLNIIKKKKVSIEKRRELIEASDEIIKSLFDQLPEDAKLEVSEEIIDKILDSGSNQPRDYDQRIRKIGEKCLCKKKCRSKFKYRDAMFDGEFWKVNYGEYVDWRTVFEFDINDIPKKEERQGLAGINTLTEVIIEFLNKSDEELIEEFDIGDFDNIILESTSFDELLKTYGHYSVFQDGKLEFNYSNQKGLNKLVMKVWKIKDEDILAWEITVDEPYKKEQNQLKLRKKKYFHHPFQDISDEYIEGTAIKATGLIKYNELTHIIIKYFTMNDRNLNEDILTKFINSEGYCMKYKDYLRNSDDKLLSLFIFEKHPTEYRSNLLMMLCKLNPEYLDTGAIREVIIECLQCVNNY